MTMRISDENKLEVRNDKCGGKDEEDISSRKGFKKNEKKSP